MKRIGKIFVNYLTIILVLVVPGVIAIILMVRDAIDNKKDALDVLTGRKGIFE